MKSLVTLEKNTPITTSKIIADGVNNKHKNVVELIQRHEERIKKFRGILPFETEKTKSGKRGRPQQYYILNEEQATFLIMLMDNSKKVLDFKESLVKAFFKMRKTLLNLATQKANLEWLEKRKTGKVSRLKETDTIKIFTEYAIKQGSKNADKYYMSLTKMENKALFLVEQKLNKNLRELLNIDQLDEVKQADLIVLKALNDGMEQQMFYKDIYQLAKKRVELFASLKGQSIVTTMSQLKLEDKL